MEKQNKIVNKPIDYTEQIPDMRPWRQKGRTFDFSATNSGSSDSELHLISSEIVFRVSPGRGFVEVGGAFPFSKKLEHF